MKSIQRRLIFAITAASLVLLTLTSLFLYQSIHAHLVRQFDGALEGQASAVSSFISLRPDGTLDFDYNGDSLGEFRHSLHAQYFVIRFANGRIFAKSDSLKHGPLLRDAAGTRPQDLILPTGRVGRIVRLDFIPSSDPDELPAGRKPPVAVPMTIVVARDRASLDSSLHDFLVRLVGCMTGLAVLNVVAMIVIVRRSLAPLRTLATCTREIGPDRLHLRLPTDGLPAELMPICTCVNELLDRLDQAFKRERRFTSDVAHELRTPIAELRALAEVASRYPNDPEYVRIALKDAVEVAKQMQSLVTTLLALVRSERMPEVVVEPVALRAAIERSVREIFHSGTSNRVHIEVPATAVVSCEPYLLASILRNVFSNAAEYSPPDSIISCRAEHENARWVLRVENQADRLTQDDLANLFEPFWRKDAARSDSTHAGLGLSLVSAYCRISSIGIASELCPDGIFSLQFTLEESTTPPPDQRHEQPRTAPPKTSVANETPVESVQ